MEMILKKANELEDCQEGKQVTLLFTNGDDYSGVYQGFDDDNTIMLEATDGDSMIGLPFDRLKNYLEEV